MPAENVQIYIEQLREKLEDEYKKANTKFGFLKPSKKLCIWNDLYYLERVEKLFKQYFPKRF